MKLKLNFIFICLFFSSSSWSIPTEYSATYSVKLKQADGLLTTKLSKQGELYSYEMITQATGIWKVISSGSVIERSTFKRVEPGYFSKKMKSDTEIFSLIAFASDPADINS